MASTQADQYPGWPVTVKQQDNYAKKVVGYLPELKILGKSDPVIQVLHEPGGEVVYSLRIQGTRFRPKVFALGEYSIKVGEEDSYLVKEHVRAEPLSAQGAPDLIFDFSSAVQKSVDYRKSGSRDGRGL
jgi:hypothetical protein